MRDISTPALSRRDGSGTPLGSDSSYMNDGNGRVFDKKYSFHERTAAFKKAKIKRHNTIISN